MSTDLIQANTTLVTVAADEAPELPSAQIAALEAILAGKSASDAATAAGVCRRTLYNWLRDDCRFQAAVNRGRRNLRQAVSARMEQVAADAAECVARAVREGNVKAAMEILKSMNFLAPTKIGSDDELVLEIEREDRLDKRDTQVALSSVGRRMMLASEAK